MRNESSIIMVLPTRAEVSRRPVRGARADWDREVIIVGALDDECLCSTL
jgi:hypothetical protein